MNNNTWHLRLLLLTEHLKPIYTSRVCYSFSLSLCCWRNFGSSLYVVAAAHWSLRGFVYAQLSAPTTCSLCWGVKCDWAIEVLILFSVGSFSCCMIQFKTSFSCQTNILTLDSRIETRHFPLWNQNIMLHDTIFHTTLLHFWLIFWWIM